MPSSIVRTISDVSRRSAESAPSSCPWPGRLALELLVLRVELLLERLELEREIIVGLRRALLLGDERLDLPRARILPGRRPSARAARSRSGHGIDDGPAAARS